MRTRGTAGCNGTGLRYSGALRVDVIAVVVVIDPCPKLASFGLVDHARTDRDVPTIKLDLHRIGMGPNVVIPAWVLSGTSLGRDNDVTAIVWRVQKRRCTRLTGLRAPRVQQQNWLAHRDF
jgi:hypothetical protein